MAFKRICFMCKEEVPIENDAGQLGFLAFHEFSGLECGSRTAHLFPVTRKDKDGSDVVLCKGEPYRAQYLEGQPRDPRPEWFYAKNVEAQIRAAYRKLQEMAEKKIE